ncbi:MAG TPA: FAD-dependent oxidoreductase, partial [Fimbriimonadaceae bacterium]|nr:FAD-dependent oxidoreductase [Fimbriimonadaceae bacterium]
GAYMWRFIKAIRVKFAQLDQRAGYLEHLPGNATGHPGVYWAGEFTQNASLDGAIRSGRECANLLLSERGELEAA